jgi:DNA adenine methylase Dam
MNQNKYKQSPMNYTGNKYKLLPQLLPLFPDGIKTFYDVCCGGLAVAMNIKADRYVCNDIDWHIIDMYKTIRESNTFADDVKAALDRYGLQDASVDDANSYIRLRDDYNSTKNPVLFFALITQAFNSILLYDSQGNCNSAYGHGKGGNCPGLTDTRLKNLTNLTNWLKQNNVSLITGYFSDLSIDQEAFVYIDPPYLITNAAYNRSVWNNVDEYTMYRWLDELTERGIPWGMSNVLRNRGNVHIKLKRWSKRYNVIPIQHKYGSLAASDNRPTDTQEVYVCNYTK